MAARSFSMSAGPTKPSAGCTTMAVESLEAMIRWLDPTASPHYVLLPKAEYVALRGVWDCPGTRAGAHQLRLDRLALACVASSIVYSERR